MKNSEMIFEKIYLTDKYQLGGSEMTTTVMAVECLEQSSQNIFRGALVALLFSLPFWLGLLGLFLWS